MTHQVKPVLKKLLAAAGLYHPSLGIKISAEEKAAIILGHKTPALRTFVETGTYKGDMVERVKNHFARIYSIELDADLYQRARNRFAEDRHVRILRGDSAEKLAEVLKEVHEPALLWLDAHESGAITADNSPVVRELEAVFAHPVGSHAILIDDARHFDRKTIRMMRVAARSNDYTFAIEDGIFILVPVRRA